MLRQVLAVTAAIAVAACASVPMASPTDNAVAKMFAAPQQGESALYIFREGQFNAAFTLSLSIGQRVIGPLAADTFFRLELPPGDYEVRCSGEDTVAVPLRLAPDRLSFLEVTPRIGVNAARCAAFEVDAGRGRAAVAGGQRAQEIR